MTKVNSPYNIFISGVYILIFLTLLIRKAEEDENMSTDLYEILKRCQKGENHAYEFLFSFFKPLLLKYKKLLGETVDITDLQYVLYRIVNTIKLDDFSSPDGTYRLLSYIKKSIYRAYIEISKNNRKRLQNIVCDYNDCIQSGIENRLDEKITLQNAVMNLPANQRKLIYMRFYKDMSDAEIAKELAVTRQAVHQTISRALISLKKQIE